MNASIQLMSFTCLIRRKSSRCRRDRGESKKSFECRCRSEGQIDFCLSSTGQIIDLFQFQLLFERSLPFSQLEDDDRNADHSLPMLSNISPLEYCWWRDELRHCLEIVLQYCLEEDESLGERSEETFKVRSTSARIQTFTAIQFTSSAFPHLHIDQHRRHLSRLSNAMVRISTLFTDTEDDQRNLEPNMPTNTTACRENRTDSAVPWLTD